MSFLEKKPDYLLDAQGDAALPFPEGFHIRFECKSFLERVARSHKGFRVVGEEQCWGLRWSRGPFTFERYTSDQEPVVDPGPHRFIFWQRLKRTDIPKGWYFGNFLTNHVRMVGFTEITQPDSYYRSWSDHGQRQRRQFLNKQKHWEQCVISLQEFLDGYAHTRKSRTLKYLYQWVVREEERCHGSLVRFVGMRRSATGTLEAAAAFIDIPEIQQSYYLASFVHDSAKKDLVILGLIDHWFRTASEKGIRFLDFGAFWAPGDPGEWKGFSLFKSKFCMRYLQYPNALMKIM